MVVVIERFCDSILDPILPCHAAEMTETCSCDDFVEIPDVVLKRDTEL